MSDEVAICVGMDSNEEEVLVGIEIASPDDNSDEDMFFPVKLSPLHAIQLAKQLEGVAATILESDAR